MRVLHVIPSIAPCRGGPSAAMVPMIRALRDVNVESAVLTTNDNGLANSEVPLGEWFTEQGVPVLAFPRSLRGLRWYDEHIVAPEALSWLRQAGADWDLLHVHAVFSYLSTRAMRWARAADRPYICRPLGQLCRWSLAQKPARKRLYLKLLEKANLEAADRVHFTSREEQVECGQAGIRVRGLVVPHGITLPARRAAAGTQGLRSILFLGRLDRKKGLERLLEGFARVADSLEGAIVTVAGSGDPAYAQALKALAEGLGISTRVRFTGWVQGREKQDLLEAADLFVLPSYSENFGVAVLEALSYGLPVLVSTEVALSRQVSRAGAGVVVEGDAASIADALLRLHRDPGPRLAMGAAGLALAQQEFSWASVAGRLKDHYAEILAAA